MEQEPDATNVVYLDEYPHLEERCRLRRMGQMTLFATDTPEATISLFETPEPPDSAA